MDPTHPLKRRLEVLQYIRDNYHDGKCEVATIEDGEFVDDPETGYFWSCFGMLIILIMQKSCNHVSSLYKLS